MGGTSVRGAILVPERLRCEYMDNPLGIDEIRPRLSWILRSSRRGEILTAYHILVAGSEAALAAGDGDLWDSGLVKANRSTQIEYEGKELYSGQRCFWKVRVWDGDGRPSPWSETAFWEMGLLKPGDWLAKWIGQSDASVAEDPGPSPFLRKTFKVRAGLARARIYASALGLYELHLNGRRVGEDLLTPGWTDYNRRVQYQTYDVTEMLAPGVNVIGAVLGDGWYCGYLGWGRETRRRRYGDLPMLLAQLRLEYADGRVETVVTDESWRCSTGPLLASDFYVGETYDARLEFPGWSSPGFEETGWSAALARERKAEVRLSARCSPPVRRIMALPPLSLNEPREGIYVYDLGQNMVGWVRLRVQGPAGTMVRLRFAEMLNPDGTIYTDNLRTARSTDCYILKGRGEEVYEPRFTFHGFRYVEVSGYPGRPGLEAITGVVIHSALAPTGSFICSNPIVNQLQSNIVWSQRGNFLEVPTDCPQRDERLGWMGDAQVFCRTACFNMDAAGFYAKWMRDVADAQSPEGGFSDVAPRVVVLSDGAPGWGDAGIIIPWTVYQCYGDRRIINEHYQAMTKWIEYIIAANPDLLRTQRLNGNYGDWLSLSSQGDSMMYESETPKEMLATAYFAHVTRLLARMGKAIGREDDAARYQDLFEDIRTTFARAYVAPDGRIMGDTQTCYALALGFELLPPEMREPAASRLVEKIRERGWHLSTGFLGLNRLLPALAGAGHLEVAYRLLTDDTYPSWGYSIKRGATTIWERWDGWSADKGFQNPVMNSFNHYSLGSVGEWLYGTVAGIEINPDRPGYEHIIIHPRPGGELTFAKAEFDSIHGRIVSDWQRQGDFFRLRVRIPVNTSATVYIPASGPDAVTEGGRPAAEAEGVVFLHSEGECAVFAVGSGEYEFKSHVG